MSMTLAVGATSVEAVSNLLIYALVVVALMAVALKPRVHLVQQFALVMALSAVALEGASLSTTEIDMWALFEIGALGVLPRLILDFCIAVAGRGASVPLAERQSTVWLARVIAGSGILTALLVLLTRQPGGPLAHLAMTSLVISQIAGITVGLAILVLAYRRQAELRAWIAVIGVGMLIAFGPLVISNELPIVLGRQPLLPYGDVAITLLAFPLAAAFAAVRWREVRVIALIDRVSVYVLLALLLLALYASTGALVGWLAATRLPLLPQVVTLGLVTGAAITYAPVRTRLQRGIDLALYRDYYEFEATLQRFSGELALLRDRESVANLLLDGLAETLNLAGIAFISLPEGLDRRVLELIEPDDLRGRREYATIEGRTQVLQGLLSLDLTASLFSPHTWLLLDPWPECAALVPIGPSAGHEVAALLIVGCKRAGSALRREDRSLLVTLAHQAATALANAQLLEGLNFSLTQVQRASSQLENARAEQQLLLRELVNAEERERAALARDLHDDALQEVLYVMRHSRQCVQLAEALSRPTAGADGVSAADTPAALIPAAEPLGRLRQELSHLAERSEVVEQKLRALCLGLYPALLHSLGLVVALDDLTAQTAQATGTDIKVVYDDEVAALTATLDPTTSLHVYRIAQEAVTNASKHAGAGAIRVRLALATTINSTINSEGQRRSTGWQALVLDVRDDGAGMALPIDYTALLRAGHLGLAGMRERAHSIGARLEVQALSGGGTSVLLAVPLFTSATEGE